jgi:hypothetical protein
MICKIQAWINYYFTATKGELLWWLHDDESIEGEGLLQRVHQQRSCQGLGGREWMAGFGVCGWGWGYSADIYDGSIRSWMVG